MNKCLISDIAYKTKINLDMNIKIEKANVTRQKSPITGENNDLETNIAINKKVDHSLLESWKSAILTSFAEVEILS